MSDFSLLITLKILDSCFRRNDDYHPMNENVIPVKTGIQKALSLKIVLRIAQFRFKIRGKGWWFESWQKHAPLDFQKKRFLPNVARIFLRSPVW